MCAACSTCRCPAATHTLRAAPVPGHAARANAGRVGVLGGYGAALANMLLGGSPGCCIHRQGGGRNWMSWQTNAVQLGPAQHGWLRQQEEGRAAPSRPAPRAMCPVPRSASSPGNPGRGDAAIASELRASDQYSASHSERAGGAARRDGASATSGQASRSGATGGEPSDGRRRAQGGAAPPRLASPRCQGDAGRSQAAPGASAAIGALASASSSLCWMRSSRPPTHTRMPPLS